MKTKPTTKRLVEVPIRFETLGEAWKAYEEWSCGAESGRSFEGFIKHVSGVEVRLSEIKISID